MLHKAWNSEGEMLYCFPRSSIKFQGHTGQNITDFDPNWAFPDYRPVAAFKSLRFALLYQYGVTIHSIIYFITLLILWQRYLFFSNIYISSVHICSFLTFHLVPSIICRPLYRPEADRFPAQWSRNAESVPMAWWRHQMETFSRHWPFAREIHRWPVNSLNKGQ